MPTVIFGVDERGDTIPLRVDSEGRVVTVSQCIPPSSVAQASPAVTAESSPQECLQMGGFTTALIVLNIAQTILLIVIAIT